jgi:hypothetical protein
MFIKSMNNLLDWMEDTGCGNNMIQCLEEYLLSNKEGQLSTIATPFPHLTQWTRDHDILGWDNFLEGCICRMLFSLHHTTLTRNLPQLKITPWAVTFIQQVLGITHKKWLYRNMHIHVRLLEGKTTEEHHHIMEQVSQMMFVDPTLLLPQH